MILTRKTVLLLRRHLALVGAAARPVGEAAPLFRASADAARRRVAVPVTPRR